MSRTKTIKAQPTEPAVINHNLDQLCRFSSALGTTLDVQTLLEEILDSLLSMVGAESVMIGLAQEDARILRPAVTKGWNIPSPSKGIPAPFIAALGTEAKGFNDLSQITPQLAGRLGVLEHPFAVMPLWAHAHLRGVVILISSGAPFSSVSLRLLTAAGRQLALAIDNSQLLTDLQRSYRKLMDTQEELIRAERLAALGQLSATMAHEIRNPLATIFSAISQIRKHSNVHGVSATLLDIAEEEAYRLNVMVSGLLEFARPKKPSFEPDQVLATLASDAVKTFMELQCHAAETTITIDCQSVDTPCLLDPDLVTRSINALLSNALLAVDGKAGIIKVRVDRHPGTSPKLVLSVSDNGVGIPPDILQKVCEPFFSTRPSGTGLGLPTASRIVEDHGGSLEIETQLGIGTTVRLLFPLNNEMPTSAQEYGIDKRNK